MKTKLSLSSTALLLTLVTGCTKEVPYEYQVKEQTHSKSEIDQKAMYLYVASTGASSRTSDVARPYWQGEEKLVKLLFTEKTLQIIEVDRETRFADNLTNNKLVMEIPVEHHQYKCAENSFGECTNKEESDVKTPWAARSSFKPDFSNIRVIEKSMLPIELENLFTGNCYSEASSKFLGYEILPDKINVQVEKTFNADISCLTKLDRLSDITFSQVYHYSIVKLNSLASPDFKPVSYPTEDENTFGFFTTQYTKLDVDNNSTVRDQVVLMNHWNPNRKVIDYHLSKEFSKPENASLKVATKIAVDRINSGFQAAGVDMQIKLHENTQKSPGDITNSMIVLVEDPTSAGVLGYGPSVANPLTGEILSARVVMYKGILESYLKYSYEEIRSKKIKEAAGKGEQKGKGLKIVTPDMMALKPLNSTQQKTSGSKKVALSTPSKVSSILDIKKDVKKMEKSLRAYTKNVAERSDKKENYLAALSKHCLYAPETVSIDEKVSTGVADVLQGDFKKWEDLDAEEKEKVIKILMPSAWIPTLVHELGHNLGLRHNFAGSEDKANFYSKEELENRGITNEIPYSSVMDYGASELDVLPDLGKYDVAALRFGYKREVVLADSKVAKIDSTLERFKLTNPTVQLKEYMFCTDESVGANAGCKRFDAGTTYTEIAKNLIENYENKYALRNFRNSRISFSMMNDLNYAGSIDYTFDSLRTFLEVRERIKYDFKLADDAPEWEQIPFLKDLNDAVLLSGQFFMNVLKTPDASCAFALTKKPEEIIEIARISDISEKAATCEELALSDKYMVVGHFGKSFVSRRSELSNNSSADEVDVRGIWIDKVLAAKYLFARKLGVYTFDKNSDNFTDIPGIQEDLVALVGSMAINKVDTVVTIKDSNGIELVSGIVPVDTLKSHIIPAAIHPMIAKVMGVPAEKSLFVKKLLGTVAAHMQSTMETVNSGRSFTDMITVHTRAAIDDTTNSANVVASVKIGAFNYHATEANQLAALLITQARVGEIVTKAGIETTQKIMKLRAGGQLVPIAGASEAEIAVWNLDPALLNAHFELGLPLAQIQDLILSLPSY